MNVLIIGGLLGLAVVAILVAVVLGIGEDRAEKAQKEAQEQQNSLPAPATFSVASQPAPSHSVPATPALSRQTVLLPAPEVSETLNGSNLADLNGQIGEITSELRALAQRAGDLQLRLSVLSAMLERQVSSQPEASFMASAEHLGQNTETQVF